MPDRSPNDDRPSIDRDSLVRMASEARKHAYAPYSGFRVGAALLAASGRVYEGCNIESVSFTPTMCAERVAVGSALAAGEKPGSLVAIAVVGDDARPSTPCGVCRQVLAELAPGALVIMAAAPELGSETMERRVEELLPDSFRFKRKQE